MKIKNLKTNKGFTIIEMMIAIAIFLIVVVMGMGALLNSHLIQKKTQGMRSVMDGLSFAMEDMSRNLRLGYDYLGGGSQISFTEAHGEDTWTYTMYNNGIKKMIQDQNEDLVSDVYLVGGEDDEIAIKSGSFTVTGTGSDDGQQPFVTIKLIGEMKYKNTTSPFSLQTSVSQRVLDEEYTPEVPLPDDPDPLPQ